jgi:hypothetical protein
MLSEVVYNVLDRWCGVMCLDMLCEVVYNVLDRWCGVVRCV